MKPSTVLSLHSGEPEEQGAKPVAGAYFRPGPPLRRTGGTGPGRTRRGPFIDS